MAKFTPEQDLKEIEDVGPSRPGGITVGEAAATLEAGLPRRTLQFRLKHRDGLREVVGDTVRCGLDRKAAIAHLVSWAAGKIEPAERERFREIAENELLGLHEGNFARYRITPAEFEAWRKVWRGPGRRQL